VPFGTHLATKYDVDLSRRYDEAVEVPVLLRAFAGSSRASCSPVTPTRVVDQSAPGGAASHDGGMDGDQADIASMFLPMATEVSHVFHAPIDQVWDLLADPERMAGLGPECVEAKWASTERGVGAVFVGKNRRGTMEWEVPRHVVEHEPPYRFAWTVLEPDNPSSTWCYGLAQEGPATVVTQRFQHGPNYSFTRLWAEERPGEAAAIIRSRLEMLAADMKVTLANAERLLGGSSVLVRRARPDEATVIAGVWLRSRAASVPAIPPPVHSDEEVRAWIRDVVLCTRDVWVAEDAGSVVAVLVLADEWVDQLYVEPGRTGEGIGAELLGLAKLHRPAGLKLWTFQANAGARRFYERHGFVATATTDGANEERAPDVRYEWSPDPAGDA
jgi:GNAT superfamily N-acetyltransferase